MNIEQWGHIVADAYKLTGVEYSPAIKSLLFANTSEIPTNTLSTEQKELLRNTIEVMSKLFFIKATKGETFGPISRIKEKYGATLEENYSLVDGPFFNMAKTYWTYQCEVLDLLGAQRSCYLAEVLFGVEFNVRCVFFPTPGPNKIDVKTREEKQREVLKEYAPEIDIERFVTESPILRAESRRSGCLSVLIILIMSVTSIICYAFE